MIVIVILWVNALSYVLVSSQDSVPERKENPSCNINNYNSFYAGPNKKLENIILGMKRRLDEIREELKNLTEKDVNSDKGKLKFLNWKRKIIFCSWSFPFENYHTAVGSSTTPQLTITLTITAFSLPVTACLCTHVNWRCIRDAN